MNTEQLLKVIEASVTTLLVRNPEFTGSLTFQCNFLKGKPQDVLKTIEKTRERLTIPKIT
jgi:hypothetical protein